MYASTQPKLIKKKHAQKMSKHPEELMELPLYSVDRFSDFLFRSTTTAPPTVRTLKEKVRCCRTVLSSGLSFSV